MDFGVKWTHERLDALEQVVREMVEHCATTAQTRKHWHTVLDLGRQSEKNKYHVPRFSDSSGLKTSDGPLFSIECSCGWKCYPMLLTSLSETWKSHVDTVPMDW